MPEIEAIWTECVDAFRQHRTWKRARRLGLSQLACLGRHTVTGAICAGGRQAEDWSADYRLFSRDKWDADDFFAPVVHGALHMLPEKGQTPAPISFGDGDAIPRDFWENTGPKAIVPPSRCTSGRATQTQAMTSNLPRGD